MKFSNKVQWCKILRYHFMKRCKNKLLKTSFYLRFSTCRSVQNHEMVALNKKENQKRRMANQARINLVMRSILVKALISLLRSFFENSSQKADIYHASFWQFFFWSSLYFPFYLDNCIFVKARTLWTQKYHKTCHKHYDK